jgi:hypothetical protein
MHLERGDGNGTGTVIWRNGKAVTANRATTTEDRPTDMDWRQTGVFHFA